MASVRKRILPSGKVRWLVDLYDGAGNRVAKQFASKGEAEAFRARAAVDVAGGTFVADRFSVTVGQAADTWLTKSRAANLQFSTLKGYEEHVELHIRPLIGAVRLSQLTPARVAAFFDELAIDRSLSMRRKVRTTLCSIVNEAQRRGLAVLNPVRMYRLASNAAAEPVVMPSRREIALLLDASEGFDRAFLQVAAFTGLRQGELRALRWQDVDLKTRSLSVRRNVTQWSKFKAPKSNAGRRTIPFGPSLAAQLAELKQSRGAADTDLVFGSVRGTPLYPGNIYNRVFKPAMTRAGLVDAKGKPRFRFHDLRHAAAAMFIEQYREPKKIQTLMGHSSIKLTYDTYGYLFQDVASDADAAWAIEDRVLSRP